MKQKTKWTIYACLAAAALAAAAILLAAFVSRLAGGILLAVLVVGVIAVLYGRRFLSGETAVRDSWKVKTGKYLSGDQELHVSSFAASCKSDLEILQIVPDESEEKGFTYYDRQVQERLAAAIVKLSSKGHYTLEKPLAILNPFGTSGNSLYLSFGTTFLGQMQYTVHVDREDIPDYTAKANDGDAPTTRHEFQIIGLVPGMKNHVTLELIGPRGRLVNAVSFTVEMPKPVSDYRVVLEHTEGESTAPLSGGLYAMIRVGGKNGYAFFYDNDGVMRYEMVLEGYSLDRILWYQGQMVTCISAYKMARFNALGQAVAIYPLEGYEMHHDMALKGDEPKVLILTSDVGEVDNVEDLLVELDLETGDVTQLLDFKDLFRSYYEQDTAPITPQDPFIWMVGKNDWIHLNTIQYLPEGDSIIVSSRETSTIIKVKGIHTAPEIDWLIGSEAFWADTDFARYSLKQVGDFVPQYGQHTVEYQSDSTLPRGQYYLRMYNNNYWANSTRHGWKPPKLPETVGTELASTSLSSQMYLYLVDENARTFSLACSFDVPYSSIVSNVTPLEGNYICNSGTAKVFGEYDKDGKLIRQFAYECGLQTYRVPKDTFTGFWFR
ncbi:MAG: aryl-sulfate sulfotransferase [Clostridiales bacterium]|nr:aryl-sulfate sulfotransferase [Clostridiales bacterium]